MNEIKRPPKKIISAVFDILESHGVHIPESNVELTLAVTLFYLENYHSGNEELARLLKLMPVQARHDKTYKIRDKFTALTREIKPENIVFLQGVVCDGEAIPVDSLVVEDKPTATCDSCGATVICENFYLGDLLCSHCASKQEDLNVRNNIELDCDSCTYERCNWHPSNQVDTMLETHYG
jgi:Zn finger protein HypA/HybF involved in hydrogenase expression